MFMLSMMVRISDSEALVPWRAIGVQYAALLVSEPAGAPSKFTQM